MKFKEGQLVRFSRKYVKWLADHADEMHSVCGEIKIIDNDYLNTYGLDKFSNQNNLDIYCLIVGDNRHFGYTGKDVCHRVYMFNQIGQGYCYIEDSNLRRL